MLKNRYIVITGIQSWNIKIGSNIKNIAIELSKNNKVLFVNPPVDRISKLKGKDQTIKYKASYLREETDMLISNPITNLWVLQPQSLMESINKIPFEKLYSLLNKKNSHKLGKEITKAFEYLDFHKCVHICDSDMFRSYYLKEILKPSISAYYSRDNLLAVDYWKRHGIKYEPGIMKKADLVLTNSVYLEKLAKKHNTNSYFVGQGCDTKAYKPQLNFKQPTDIEKTTQPTVGYIGSLNSLRLDISVVEHIAITRPSWKVVLVGPEDSAFKASKLHQLKNVQFTGSKAESELAEYLNVFDVAINPQLFNEVTIGNYPRKIDEYLAMGKPTVATKTEAMDYFSDYVSLAETKEDWITLIEKELLHSNQQLKNKRIEFASLHTWENNVKEIGRRIINRELELKSKIDIYESAS